MQRNASCGSSDKTQRIEEGFQKDVGHWLAPFLLLHLIHHETETIMRTNYKELEEGKFRLTHYSTSSQYKLEKYIDEDEMHNPIDNPHWETVTWLDYGEIDSLYKMLVTLNTPL